MISNFVRIATITLVVCAVIITALLVRREFFLSEAIVPKSIPLRHLSDSTWKQLIKSDLMSGSQNAKIKIVEFFDYECPYCRRIQPTLNEIRRRYPNDVAIIYRHFPLPYHSAAFPSAVASECANEQGKFEVYHRKLFEHQGQATSTDWVGLARNVEIPNITGFRECIEQSIPSEKIYSDMRLGESLEIAAIPTLIVDGMLFQGALAINDLDKIVQKALQSQSSQIPSANE